MRSRERMGEPDRLGATLWAIRVTFVVITLTFL